MRKLGYTCVSVGAALLMFAATLYAAPAHAAGNYQRFIVTCPFSHTTAPTGTPNGITGGDDPIVFPNQPGVSHVHSFFGNTLTNYDNDYNRMVGGSTTCTLLGDTAGYWVPALRNKTTGVLINPVIAFVYYYANTQAIPDAPIVPFPPNYSIITTNTRWMCGDNETPKPNVPQNCTNSTAPQVIQYGAGVWLEFDKVCWDGFTMAVGPYDAHVAIRVRGVCPAAFPIRLPLIEIKFRYGIKDISNYEPASMPNKGMHSDFWNTWNQAVLQAEVSACLQPGQAACNSVSG